MRITVLGSGSTGNAALVEAGDTRLLVDAGVPVRTLTERAAGVGFDLKPLSGIVLTHAHCDHAAHGEAYARAFDAPLYMTESTRRGLRFRGTPRTRLFGSQSSFSVGSIQVFPHPVPHDAPQVALVFEHEGHRAAIVTDLGHAGSDLRNHLANCGTVLLESNYDPELLRLGPYPPSVQARVAGPRGHLSNAQCADFAGRLSQSVKELVLIHVSENNNRPELALALTRAAVQGKSMRVRVAASAEPLGVDVPRTPQQLRLSL